MDPDLVIVAELLDSSAAKHKMAVRPKKNHPKVKTVQSTERWLVRVLEDVSGGEMKSRQGWVPCNVLKDQKDCPERDLTALAARRQAVVRELIETEEEFGRDMHQVVNQYMRPMDKATTPKNVFDNRELLFSNFKQIAEFHSTVLLEGIKYYAGEPKMLGRALLRMEREFDKHVNYCRDEPRAQQLLASDPDCMEYFQNLADDLGDDKGLAEHLKLPIQRINDYQLLLKELVKYSKRIGEDYTDLQKALELFLGVPSRAKDNQFLASIEGYRGNIYKLGRLLTHDWFTVEHQGKTKERYLFLFKARVLICKVKRVGDDRSIFDLKDIVKLPEAEVKDCPEDKLKFELHNQKEEQHIILTAHKEQHKTFWLKEIKQHISDLVALAEHAADDLQLLVEAKSPEPPSDKGKKRELRRQEEKAEEAKRTKVDVIEVLTREESLAQLKAKRKASLEQAEIAKKISKTEVTEVSISEVQESEVKSSSKFTASEEKFESKKIVSEESYATAESFTKTQSAVVESKEQFSSQVTSQSRKQSFEQIKEIKQSDQDIKEIESKYSVTSRKASLVEDSSKTSQEISSGQVEAVSTESSEVIAQSLKAKSLSPEVAAQSLEVKSQISEVVAKSTEVKSQTSEVAAQSSEVKSQTSEVAAQSSEVKSQTSEVAAQISEVKSQTTEVAAQSSEVKSQTSEVAAQSSEVKSLTSEVAAQSLEVKSQISEVVAKSTEVKSQTSEVASQIPQVKSQISEVAAQSSEVKSQTSEVAAQISNVKAKSSEVVTESTVLSSKSAEVLPDKKVEDTTSKEKKEDSQTVAENGDEMSSRYSRSSRLSGDYSTSRRLSSTSGKYESSSTYESGSSSYRRESGSKIETGRFSTGGTEAISSKSYEASSKFESSAKNDNGVVSGAESAFTSSKAVEDGVVKSETSYSSSNAISNGSVTEKSAIRATGKPHFSTTIEGQNIEPGQNARFQCTLQESSEAVKMTWLKDNKPLTDILMDRVIITSDENNHKLEVKHCSVEDSGLYTARAENSQGNAHCTAQLVVYKLTPEERAAKNALNAPYFLVALNNTEIMENTYLRFMVKVKGEPNPKVTFYRNDEEIKDTTEDDRIQIVRTLADVGCYELVIRDVIASDQGKYSCKAVNNYGEDTCEAYVVVVEDKNIFYDLLPGGEGLLNKGEKPTFSWKKDGEAFNPEERFKVLLGEDENSLALVFQNVKPEDVGLYTCIAKTSTGNIACSAELTVQGAVNQLYREPEKPKLVIEKRTAEASIGGTAILELQCKGYPKPELIFKHKGETIEADARHKFMYEDDETMSLVIKNVETSDAGTYEVSAKNELGLDTQEVKLTVKAPPQFKQKIENQTCKVGVTHTVTVEVEGSPTPEVSFFKEGKQIKSSEHLKIVKESDEVYKITLKDAKLIDTGSYSVVAKNDFSQTSDIWQWNVVTAPKISKKMGKEKICSEGETVRLEVKAEAEPAPTVTWFKNKVEISESEEVKISSSGGLHSITIESSLGSDSGTYECKISNEIGSVSDSLLLKVKSAPSFATKLEDKTAKEGDTKVEFVVKVDAYPEPKIQWFHGDVDISEKKTIYTRVKEGNVHKLIIKEVKAEMEGDYYCKVKNDLGEDICDAFFTVNTKPRITKKLVDMAVSEGQTLKLEVEVEGSPEPTVKWFKDGVEVNLDARVRIERDTQSLENYYLTVTLVKEEDGGEYEVRAENEMGSVSSKSIVTVHTKEVHSKFDKDTIEEQEIENGKSKKHEIEEKSFWDDIEGKKAKDSKTINVENSSRKAENHIRKIEIVEEKSFWDDIEEDGNVPHVSIDDSENQTSFTAKRAVKESKTDKNIDEENKVSKIVTDDAQPVLHQGQKSISESQTVEYKTYYGQAGDDHNLKQIDETENKPGLIGGLTSITTTETVEQKSYWGDEDDEINKGAPGDVSQKPFTVEKNIRTKIEIVEEQSYLEGSNDDCKVNRAGIVKLEEKSQQAQKTYTKTETVEKSFWDENDDSVTKLEISDASPKPYSVETQVKTTVEMSEERSYINGDEDNGVEKRQISNENVNGEAYKTQKSISKSETKEEKSILSDVNDDGKKRKPKSDSDDYPKTMQSQISKTESKIEDEDYIKHVKESKFIESTQEFNKHSTLNGFTEPDDIENVTFSISPPKKSVQNVISNEINKNIATVEIIEEKSSNSFKSRYYEDETIEAPKASSREQPSEEKSFWDDTEDNLPKKRHVVDVMDNKCYTSQVSNSDEKSFWDEVDDEQKSKVPKIHETGHEKYKTQRSFTDQQNIDEKNDSNENEIVKKLDIIESEHKKSYSALIDGQNVDEKSFWDDTDENKAKNTNIDQPEKRKSQKSFSEPQNVDEKLFWDDDNENEKAKKPNIEESERRKSYISQKSFIEPQNLDDKSFWDDDNADEKAKNIEESEQKTSYSAQKSFSELQNVDEKSFWDDNNENEKAKKPNIEESDRKKSYSAQKSFNEPQNIDEKSFWDDNYDNNDTQTSIYTSKPETSSKKFSEPEIVEEIKMNLPKKTIKQDNLEEPMIADHEGRVFQTVTTFKKGEDGAIIVSKVSSSKSHGAIITGPAETHTIHKMKSTSVYYDDDDHSTRKVIKPNQPHSTSLEVEEIASHSYFLSDLGQYSIPDHVRRGTYGIIEEPTTDSEAESTKYQKQYSTRTISIMSLSEDENSYHEPLSREISIEDLSKSIFDIDESRKVFSKDSYIRQSSFQEDFLTEQGEQESVIYKEKSHKIFDNDITDKIMNISKEFDDIKYKDTKEKVDNVKNRLIEELVFCPKQNIENVTKNITESTVEKRKGRAKLYCVEEERDEDIDELLRRSSEQRNILDDIITREDIKASPVIKKSNMKNSHIYESLPLHYTVEAVGVPKPTARWIHDGEDVESNKRIIISEKDGIYKLEFKSVTLEDAGRWQCEVSNEIGKKVQKAELSVDSVNEFRKPMFTQPLEAQKVTQREPVCMTAVCTADPLPHVAWMLNGEEIKPNNSLFTNMETRDIEHGLKECTFTLNIPSGLHSDTGVYTLLCKNQYGTGESSARLDILLRPEIEPIQDITTEPLVETRFITKIQANPIAEVQWKKDGYVIQPSPRYEIVEDRSSETFELIIKETLLDDAGVYEVKATNEVGENSKQARVTIHTEEPVITRLLQKQTVKDYDDCSLKIRCDGVPKPKVIWYKDNEEVKDDERHVITTEVGGQVDSELAIKHFCAKDAGLYKAKAVSLAGEAKCQAEISLSRSTPSFIHRLERQKDVDEGEVLELKARVEGSPMPTAKWYRDGEEISPEDPRVMTSVSPDGNIRLVIQNVTPEDCGAYKLVITNKNGEHSALCAVAVNPTPRKPSFSQELEDQKAIVGEPLKLIAKVMAYPAPEVKWFKDGQPIRPSQALNFINQPGGVIGLSLDSAREEDQGVYSVTVTNKLGDIASKANVEVQQREKRPGFACDLQPTKVIEGFPVKMEVKLVGHPAPTVTWTHNGVELIPDGEHIRIVCQPDGTQTLIIDRATADDAGEYGVIARNDMGENESKAPLVVASRTDDSQLQERPQLIHGLRDMSCEEGTALQLSAPFVANPIPEVTWTKDGVEIKPSHRVAITCDGRRVGLEINPAEMSDAGIYEVKLVNPLGEDSGQGNISIRKVFSPPIFTQKFTDLQQLPTFDAKFPARVNGLPFPEVQWYKDFKPIQESEKYHLKRDGDAVCLYVRDVQPDDAGKYKCVAKNKEGQAECEAQLEIVDTLFRKQKVEPPSFLKRIGDTEVYRGLSAKFTACATGSPEPDVEWYRNGDRLFPCDRIRMDKESTGLLRLIISGVDQMDVGTYACRIINPHGEETCCAELTYDSLEPRPDKKPIADQYSDFDKMKKTGVPMPLCDRPIISRMTDRHLTLSWKPSIPHGARFPVTYQVEMCEVPDGDWFTARTGLRNCVCDVRNLEPFRDYKFRIRVENKYGVSDPSPFATTHRSKLEPEPPKFVPYLPPGIDFRPDTSPYFPKDFDLERPPRDGHAQAPRFLRQEHDSQYGVKGHNATLFWFVYGYPKPKMSYFFNDEPIEIGGRYDWSYTRNGQATLFINKMLERDVGWYEAVATNEHGQARQRVRLEVAEYPQFIQRPEETVALQRKTARMEARVIGVPYPEIKWYKDWQPITASARIKIQFVEPDMTVLLINDAIMKDEGLYSVSARNVAGSVSSSAMLHIEESENEYIERVREQPPRVRASSKPFGEFYDIGDELGRGVQGTVYHAAERLTGRNYAAKIMHGDTNLKPFMKNELDIMNHLNSPHLIRLHEAFEQDHTVALVTELAGGGELVRDKLLRGSACTEREIAGYVRQMLRGLKHMHDNNIAHLGLTIGELLLSHAGSDELKLCDFGLSRRVQFGKHATLQFGMPEFVAPEVANEEGVACPADMWSVGVITYILLGGHSPFRGANDRETLTKVREGKWEFHDEEWWSRFSREARDFISRLLVYKWTERMDVNQALNHPWLGLADKMYNNEYNFNMDRLRNYYNLYRDWTSNAQCRNWFRRRPLSGAFEHPSKMVYPPGHEYTPEGTPMRERDPHERKGSPFDIKFKQWDHPDWEVNATSESHYQYGPDTYLLQLRDTNFPVRLREYMKVACNRSPGYSLNVHDTYDPRTPIIRERRRFTDIMDEEIDDERKERINNYGTESYTIRRLRHELGTRLDSYAEIEAIMEAKKDGQIPFLREKPQLLPVRDGEPAQLSCMAVGEPKPAIQWFKNDMVIAEGTRIKIIEDQEGRSTLQFNPARHHDIGFYKVVARNKVGQTIARTRIVEATVPDAPDSPTATETSDTEILLRWKQPKYDGNSPVVCYSLQYKEGDSVDWLDVAQNIDHEFYLVKNLKAHTNYHFRLSSRNKIGWSDKGIPTHLVKTNDPGVPKIELTKAMKHLQQLTEAGQEINLSEEKPRLDYRCEENPIEWDSSNGFTERYSFISELWRGKFSIVVKGVDKRDDSLVVAKILETRPETEVQVQREYECLRRLRHERIANLLAAYQAPGSAVTALILEKLQGADVLTYLASRHDYTEQMVATIVTQVLDALQYIHWRGYCHLDLQPDNVVMASVRTIQVKLVDFGSAHKVTKLGTSVPQVGDLEYKAPEIVNDEPAFPQTDIWSLGVLTYILLSGQSPFKGENDVETKQNISFVRYRFEHLYKEISQEATRFLMFLFKKVPQKRPLAEECYEHRWLTQSDFMIRKRERAVFLGNRLKEFSDAYHERKAQESTQADTVDKAFGQINPRQLTRSNSIQEELLTNTSFIVRPGV